METLRACWRLVMCGLASSMLSSEALGLPGAINDSEDRFPFVVEINLRGRLICSGAVLFPRIVVTAAHCLQQKLYWRGRAYYIDEYLKPAEVSVSVTRAGKSQTYAVEEIDIAPNWRTQNGARPTVRFRYDIALIVTQRPLATEIPSSPLDAPEKRAEFEAELTGSPAREGVLVAFGGNNCPSMGECNDAGVRRFLTVPIKEESFCFSRGLAGRGPTVPLALWCLESKVMFGDSGGALLIKLDDGKLFFVGVISAQQGLPIEFAGLPAWRRSVATSLYPNLPFIAEKARELGYMNTDISPGP